MADRLQKWIGLTASFIYTTLTGLFLSFNVYAVELKRTFDFNQTQVELIGSFTVAGLTVVFLGPLVIDKCGYKTCFVLSWAMVTSSSLLMWLAAENVEFFRNRLEFLCAFQFMGTAGLAIAQNCCISVGVLRFSAKHSAKLIGLYMALTALGKVYYSVLYGLCSQFEDGYGKFFLSVSIGVSIMSVACWLFHSAPQVEKPAAEPLLAECAMKSSPDYLHQGDKSAKRTEVHFPTFSEILRSCYVHLILWPNTLFCASAVSYMNNVTSIATSLHTPHPEMTVYVMSFFIVISRVSFGIIFDRYGGKMFGIILLIICYLALAIAMLIGLTWLNNVSIYPITILVSMGCGAGVSVPMAVLTAFCGPHRFHYILASSQILISCFTIIVQLIIGLTYDHMYELLESTTFLCAECFHWTYVILLCISLFAALMQLINVMFV